jgi:hypothetical protein
MSRERKEVALLYGKKNQDSAIVESRGRDEE